MLTENKVIEIAQKSFDTGKATSIFELRDAVVNVLTRKKLFPDIHRSFLTCGGKEWSLICKVTQEVWNNSSN